VALPNYRLSVRFVDGLTGTVDMSALIASPQAGVFARLRAHWIMRGNDDFAAQSCNNGRQEPKQKPNFAE